MATVPTLPASYAVGNKWRAVQEATPHAQGLNLMLGPPQCEVANHGTLSLGLSVWTLVPFDAETYDNDTMHDLVTNTSRVIAQTAGRYDITASMTFAANALGGSVQAQIRKNAAGAVAGGTQVILASGKASAAAGINPTLMLSIRDLVMAAADYVELFVIQDAAAARLTIADAPNTYLRARYVATT